MFDCFKEFLLQVDVDYSSYFLRIVPSNFEVMFCLTRQSSVTVSGLSQQCGKKADIGLGILIP